jgi:uncharacterized repeat protein (TIGR03803 family)
MKTRVTFFCRLFYCLLTAAVAACSSPRSAILPQTAAPEFAVGADHARAGYKLLYLFKGGGNGAEPFAGLTKLGSLFYGVAYGNRVGAGGYGTVFSIAPSGKEHTLYAFKGAPSDGAEPVGNLVAVGNTLYGTTYNGGKYFSGTIFSITSSGHEHVVYSFKGGSTDGAQPAAGLIELGGKLYGTTQMGGSVGAGTVFEATSSGTEHPLHAFTGYPSDGDSPQGSLIAVHGKLYGTTHNGGKNGEGTVFEMSTSGKEGWIYSFAGAPNDGYLPYGGLTIAGKGFYGTTSGGNGGIYAITPSGKETFAYAFKGGPGDGAAPVGNLVHVGHEFFGTTTGGGAHDMGTIFEAGRSSEKMLYSFKGSPKDGADPHGTLLYDKDGGVLYGTTVEGGVSISGGRPYSEAGSIFRFKP